ncbi:hypothetical protein N7603_05520 [Acholeplasma vituli]|uniref:Uncharacterized protein n=1 Tax=Paracholeplasma vituli TaxID=69473 RepID=A0ABT2PZH2_9MOLU|nr:hypothetical protein [Paracholeplasma vituli]MCU0105112.1 hypothetical protein [Paracholeplasma vituli]
MNNKELEDMKLKIINRNNLFKWITLFTVIVFIILGTFFGKIVIDLSDFSFSDLISILISLWAVYISMLFYHKNNEASAGFYNNFYVFIKDVTEKIGKLDVGVNEKLTHLKDGVFGSPILNKEIKSEKEKYQKQELEKQKIIDDLIKKSELDEEEKDKLRKKLFEMDNYLRESRVKIENSREAKYYKDLQDFSQFVISNITMKSLRRLANGDNTVTLVDRYNKIINLVPSHVLDTLRKLDFINDNNIINQRGYEYLEAYSNSLK